MLFVFGIKFRRELPEGFKRAFGTGLLPVILLNLFIGFMGQRFIDNAAHLGGLISGAALAAVADYRRPGERASMALVWRVLQVAAIALVVVSFVGVVQNFPKPEPPVVRDARVMESLKFTKAMNDAQEIFEKRDRNGVDPAIAALEATSPPDIKADQLKRKLEVLLQRAKQPDDAAEDAKASQQRQIALRTEFEAWKKEYEDWLRTSAKRLSVTTP